MATNPEVLRPTLEGRTARAPGRVTPRLDGTTLRWAAAIGGVLALLIFSALSLPAPAGLDPDPQVRASAPGTSSAPVLDGRGKWTGYAR